MKSVGVMDDGDKSITDTALDQLYNAVGYGTPAEGMSASIMLIVLAVVATFLSFGATLFLVVLFTGLFFVHLLRSLSSRFNSLFPGGR